MTVLGGPVTALLEQGSTAEALAPCLIALLGAGPAWIGWCAEIRHERRHRRSDGDGARRLEMPKATLFFGLLRLLLRLPGGWRRLTVYRGRRVVVTTPRRREELTVRRRALPLLIPPGIVETITRTERRFLSGVGDC